MSKTAFLTPSWEDYEPAFNQTEDGLIVPNDRAGEPRPLNNIGVPIELPTLGDHPQHARFVIEPADTLKDGVWARIVPGTRIVEVAHPGLEHVLVSEAGYIHCDPPKKTTRKQAASSGQEA